jgi:hypothetical protein
MRPLSMLVSNDIVVLFLQRFQRRQPMVPNWWDSLDHRSNYSVWELGAGDRDLMVYSQKAGFLVGSSLR